MAGEFREFIEMMAPTPALPHEMGEGEIGRRILDSPFSPNPSFLEEGGELWKAPTPALPHKMGEGVDFWEGGELRVLTLVLLHFKREGKGERVPFRKREGKEGFYMLVGWVVCIFMHVHQYFGIGGQIGGQKNFWWTMVKMALSQGNQRFNNVRE